MNFLLVVAYHAYSKTKTPSFAGDETRYMVVTVISDGLTLVLQTAAVDPVIDSSGAEDARCAVVVCSDEWRGSVVLWSAAD